MLNYIDNTVKIINVCCHNDISLCKRYYKIRPGSDSVCAAINRGRTISNKV